MFRLAAPFALLTLAACVPTTVPPPAAGACGSGQWQSFVGSPVADLQLAGLPTSARIIRPGDAITMDYSERRLNVELDGRDRIARVFCG